MEENLQIPKIMATHSYRKALSYLLFSIFVLVASIVITILFMSDLSNYSESQLLQNETRMSYAAAVIFGLILLGGSVLSLRVALQNFFVADKLERNGRLTDGVITNKWEDTFERRVLYYVSYRFHEDMEAWETISKRLYRKLGTGSNVPVRFLEHDPRVSRLDCERLSAS